MPARQVLLSQEMCRCACADDGDQASTSALGGPWPLLSRADLITYTVAIGISYLIRVCAAPAAGRNNSQTSVHLNIAVQCNLQCTPNQGICTSQCAGACRSRNSV